MLTRVIAFIKEKELFAPGARLLVAVSGGPDSVCLLHILHRLSSEMNLSLVVAHLDHGLRGSSSAGDALFVESLARQWSWPVVVARRRLGEIHRQQGGSLQELCRRVRLQFLRRAAAEYGAHGVALAHHGGDQTETILLNLVRGAGLGGLAGMEPVSDAAGLKLVRPLLYEKKTEIMNYLKDYSLPFRIDASNAAADYRRNQLRLQVVPLLTALNPDLDSTLGRMASILRAEDDYLGQLAAAVFQRAKITDKPLALDSGCLAEIHPALQRRVLRLAWEEIMGVAKNLSFKHGEAVLALLNGPVGQSASLPGDWQVRRGYKGLVFEEAQRHLEGDWQQPLTLPGSLDLPRGGKIAAGILPREDFFGFSRDKKVAYCDLGALRSPRLTIRFWRPGDCFYPLGMEGSKKLQDYFSDEKIDRGRRSDIPLVVDGDAIVWIAGMRLDRRYRLTEESRQLLRLEFLPQA